MSSLDRLDEPLAGISGSPQIRGSADLALDLVRSALESQRSADFVEAAGRALFHSPLRVQRLFVSMKALHPVFRARTYLWRWETGHVASVEWPHGLENRLGYYDSPDHFVHRTGSELRVRRPGEDGEHACDLYGTLRAEGYTDYLIVPLRFSDGTVNTLSIATKEPNGFRDGNLDWFRQSVPLLTVVLERHAALEALDSVLDTYLGDSVGQQIRGGRIRPGDGELVDAVILMADLHDFTRHSARLGPTDTVRLLNSYFDCLVDPISENGGHVIKFMGDAVLAFFPMLQGMAAPAPFQAVLATRRRLAALNEARATAGQIPLRHALCLHYGRVLYGNIGSSNRFDFTIIGDAVNLTARGVDAAKDLGVEYLFTGAFVQRFGMAGLTRHGRSALKGIDEPLEMFTLADGGSS
jgi:adenylate cyclase